MSGIYIPNISMPKDGSFEVLVVHDNGIVTKGFFPNENEHTKAIFIPDHGRLIDADAIDYDDYWWNKHYSARDCKQAEKMIKEQPTIIPADKDGET